PLDMSSMAALSITTFHFREKTKTLLQCKFSMEKNHETVPQPQPLDRFHKFPMVVYDL
ncbi:hypothetical protein AVEN_82157-2-1, partial [Araneus ventricosus]